MCQNIEPNIFLPFVNIKLTAITVNRKNINPNNDVIIRHLQRQRLSAFMRRINNSARGTSSVKSASGRPAG